MAFLNDFEDDDLRRRFATLRAEEEARAPRFAASYAAQARHVRQRSGIPGKLIAATACVAIIVAAAFWRPSSPRREGQPVAALAQWKAPTDFLLQTPGRELLQTVPTLGTSPDFGGASLLGRDHQQQKKQVRP